METSKILTASLLDLLFDNRNKDYGAYELRKTYRERIFKSLLITITIAGLAYAGAVLARSTTRNRAERYRLKEVVLQSVPEEKQPEKIPDPPKQQPPQVRTEIFTPPVIVDKDKVDKPPPEMDDLDSAKIGLVKQNGIVDDRIPEINKIEDKGIIESNKTERSDEPFTTVQIEATYAGNWGNFLRRNLRPEVAADNNAPAGRYTVIIQFVVDVDGSISNITAVTNVGYGMEQEAVRVIKRSDKWEPAFQNGMHVKAYRRQPITFEVLAED